ncbi:MAG: hypothetical protein BWK80_17425 [Desulfobacteraceae bacterium IS3]|nr:MAG: hypothetical protein BWK80_17425 [Desulfobacteraceae bacterium IS3]
MIFIFTLLIRMLFHSLLFRIKNFLFFLLTISYIFIYSKVKKKYKCSKHLKADWRWKYIGVTHLEFPHRKK